MKVRNSIFGIIALVTLCVIGCKKDPLFDTTEITTKQVTSITGWSAVSGGEVTSDGTPTISKRGVCWSTSPVPTINDYTVTHHNGGLGKFSVTMDGLSENTTYYVRAFAWNSTGAIYGEEYSFTTPYKPILSTLEAEEVTSVSAVCGGNITDDGNATITQRGLCWSTHENPTIEDSTSVVDSVGIGTFKSEMTKLTPGTLYYVRAYATNVAGTGYGDVQQFTTQNIPVLKATEIANVTQETVVCSGSILDNAGADVTEQGFCWSTTPQPTTENEKITATAENGLGDFSITISGLQWGTTYYVRSYATNSVGTAYGDETSFTTWDVPTVSKPNATTITAYTITCETSILFDGGTPITEKGLCWSTSSNPTIENNKLQITEGEETFSGTITGLTRGTTYYIRPYATNVVGTNYGEEIEVSTHTLATVSTITPSDITYNSAILKGNVTADGGTTVTERGVCWSTSTSPTVSDNKQSVGNGIGTIKVTVTGLNDGVTYYVRAYAINSVGTNYGKQLSFTTTTITAPSVTTTDANNVSYTSVTLGGNVTTENGAAVTERGVCWSTSANPTISNSKKAVGSGTGTFTTDLTGLNDGVTYYVRAYATNERGTSYGEEKTFTTTKITAPTVTTTAASNISYTSVTLGGNVTKENGASVTERGVCWSTSTNPTISNSKKTVGSGTGTFTIEITGLSNGVTYYVRAYAINERGTSYGSVISFTTKIIGTIPYAFSVSKNKKIYFSQGNLQYQASTNTWRFAEHQYDMIGAANENISSTYSGWIDLFGLGTSGWNSGANACQPYSASIDDRDYFIGGLYSNNLTGNYANADWGVYNKISNGGNQTGQWRTLTGAEWIYLLNTRANASSKKGVAKVNGVNGLVLLPDDWTLPYGIKFTSGVANNTGSEYYATVNNYTSSQWSKMEANGAVFLPAAGYRRGTSVSDVGSQGFYYSSTCANQGVTNTSANGMYFMSSIVSKGNTTMNRTGSSVRLVRDNL